MDNKELLEKYEPILVVQLLRVPPMNELQAFAQKLQNDFGYKVLVLPGDIETKVELLSVLKSEVKEISKLQTKVLKMVDDMEKEYKKILNPVGESSEDGKKE
tara:strand:+ start:81 stop:386 length:306 start_codon:yes stop_codon:yes gene_type:complete